MIANRTSRHLLTGFVMALLVLITTSASDAVLLTEYQDFDTAASTAAQFWSGQNNGSPNNYGFSNTTNAGGPAGEAGGVFGRTAALAYFADTRVKPTGEAFFDLFDAFGASGRIALVGSSTINAFFDVGHFDRGESSVQAQAIVGFSVQQSSPGNFAIAGRAVAQGSPSFSVGPGTYLWSYTYDPNFSGADGRMTFELRTTGGALVNSFFINVVAGAKTGRSASTGGYLDIDTFGIVSGQNINNFDPDTLQAYIDTVSYTGVPEPGSLALIGLAGVLVVRRRRQQR